MQCARSILAICVALFISATATQAAADDATSAPAKPRIISPSGDIEPTTPPPSATSAPSGPLEWYGWQIILVDAASLTNIYVGLTQWQTPTGSVLTGLGVAGVFLGGPIVHAAHQQWPRAAGSFLLRVVGPSIGAGVSDNSCRQKQGASCEGAPILGYLLGFAATSAIDAAALAYAPGATPDAASFRLAPTVALGKSNAQIGLMGNF